jgi:glutamate-5-semialdehyde dehydrogenase
MTDIPEKIEDLAKKANQASLRIANLSTEIKNKALDNVAETLLNNKSEILKQNAIDVSEAEKNGLSKSLLKRLILTDEKIDEIIKNVISVKNLEDPVGKTLSAVELDTNLELYQITCPIGVIGMVFESRPDALVQIASLCIKSGNAVIMKGGSEALNSNKCLHSLITQSISSANPLFKDSIILFETREEVDVILKMDKYIQLLIPRGSSNFVEYVKNNTKIPVLGHSEGICHIYVDKYADRKKALEICFDAKCQYPAVCNAMETLLVHRDIANSFLPDMIKKFKNAGVEIRGCPETISIVNDIKLATEQDWRTEYNDLILSIKIVSDIDEAVEHINHYGSHHTDAIITEDNERGKKFLNFVDSSSIMQNCSTRFSDGYKYGKGAELGISTNKIHARGPVGLEGLVIYKYILIGNGHTVSQYVGENAKNFTHRKIV